jgi:hypothetical protein
VICLIVGGLDVSSLAALEAACSHLRKMIVNARLWRRIFMAKMEMEPGLQVCTVGCCVGDPGHFVPSDYWILILLLSSGTLSPRILKFFSSYFFL